VSVEGGRITMSYLIWLKYFSERKEERVERKEERGITLSFILRSYDGQ
jgi:hypothetical protein